LRKRTKNWEEQDCKMDIAITNSEKISKQKSAHFIHLNLHTYNNNIQYTYNMNTM